MKLVCMVVSPFVLATCLAGCAKAPPSQQEPVTQRAASGNGWPERFRHGKRPLTFDHHVFRAVCYDTPRCSVRYAGMEEGDHEPAPPSTDFGPTYLDHILGGHVGIPNFPGPARLDWISRDGTRHTAEIDIGRIFQDEHVLHRVPPGDIADLPDGKITIDPLILLEINDRTVRVYMRAYVPTMPGHSQRGARHELVEAKTYRY